jgi:hypothetical protein
MRAVPYTRMTAIRLSGPAREYFPSLGSIATLRLSAEDLPVSPVWLVSLGDARVTLSVARHGCRPRGHHNGRLYHVAAGHWFAVPAVELSVLRLMPLAVSRQSKRKR